MRLGIDIGGTKIGIGVFTDSGELLSSAKINVADKGKRGLAEYIAENANRLISEIPGAVGNVHTCGVGIPGTVSADGRSILKAPNLDFEEDFRQRLESALGIDCKFIQDSRAAALGEYRCGAGKGAKTLICVTLGTGIGTGIVIDGKLYHGALGSSGELGHIPAIGERKPRGCGCGKNNCIEKYAAGGGLDITARELIGENATARDLFNAVEHGDCDALREIENAVELIGVAMVGAVNLLSPDHLLFSGGLSENDRFLSAIISYISEHCYSSGELPHIGKAALGELAPLYGAAMYPESGEKRIKPQLAASVMCADFLHMGEALAELEAVGVNYIHCDIMDNHFVPNLMLPPEFCNKIRKGSRLPFDYHIMCERPETLLERLDIREGDFISIHYESTVHVQRMLALVKKLGARPAIALNPATPLEVLTDILPDVEMILIMSVNPGFAAQAVVPSAFARLRRLRKMLAESGRSDIIVEVDGNCSFENLPKMYDAGGDLFVVGSSSLFSKTMSISEAYAKIADGFNVRA